MAPYNNDDQPTNECHYCHCNPCACGRHDYSSNHEFRERQAHEYEIERETGPLADYNPYPE